MINYMLAAWLVTSTLTTITIIGLVVYSILNGDIDV